MKKVTATWNPSDPFRSITNAAYHIGKENDEKTREEFLAAQLKNLNLKGTSDVFLSISRASDTEVENHHHAGSGRKSDPTRRRFLQDPRRLPDAFQGRG